MRRAAAIRKSIPERGNSQCKALRQEFPGGFKCVLVWLEQSRTGGEGGERRLAREGAGPWRPLGGLGLFLSLRWGATAGCELSSDIARGSLTTTLGWARGGRQETEGRLVGRCRRG